MQVIVCDDDIENLNEMIQVCYDVLANQSAQMQVDSLYTFYEITST